VTFFAHSENSAGIKHDLVEHLKSVAQLAGKFAEKFGAAVVLGWRRRRRSATPEVRVASCYPASVASGTGTNLAEVDIVGNVST